MKLFSLLTLATAVTARFAKPTTKIAGVEVINTPIVRDAQALIKKFPAYLYSHQMRSWLFGAAMINANQTLKREIDLEVHAVATLLHDLGMTTSYTSTRRDSTATEATLAYNTNSSTAGKMADYTGKRSSFDDDEKTLSNLTLNDSSSTHSRSKLSGAMKQLKSKLTTKEEKPKKQKAPIPANYYPNNLQTFEALHASRM
ncbi:hypothetical protein NUW58_g3056 [Xylaria curta]|uniref:Uncharacterized protein n=1 Tax=Xylaria curta TaxID=42375 RepID=A0ACC1PEA6_9PEZI|nr:hypothetical protein NUW58_g3056 [Xylaria curta]